MATGVSTVETTRTRVRFTIVAMLFAVTMVNYADRATISIAGPALSKDLGLSPVQMGYVFSAFGWSYVAAQIPGGWLLDRFGSKSVYFWSIFIWSLFTLLQGSVGVLGAGTLAVTALFTLRLLVGLAEAPSFPANARIVAAWFPANERGTASAIFNSAQYFATVLFAPIMGWITFTFGWPYVFYFMGMVGILICFIWLKVIYSPKDHPRLSPAELDYIERGGALVDMDQPKKEKHITRAELELDYVERGGLKTMNTRSRIRRTRRSGASSSNCSPIACCSASTSAQYCITTITYFFLTWFPVYLVQQRGMSILNAGMVASIPAICGFVGGVLGGVISDFMLRKGWSLTVGAQDPDRARHAAVDEHDRSATTSTRSGSSSRSWRWPSSARASARSAGPWSPTPRRRKSPGSSGGLFNTFGNIASITTPIVIGYIIQSTGSFNGAWSFVAAQRSRRRAAATW